MLMNYRLNLSYLEKFLYKGFKNHLKFTQKNIGGTLWKQIEFALFQRTQPIGRQVWVRKYLSF